MNQINRRTRLLSPLSKREKQILDLISRGCTTKEIGEELFLSPRTVEKYRQHMLMKSQSRNSAHLVSRAYEFGLF